MSATVVMLAITSTLATGAEAAALPPASAQPSGHAHPARDLRLSNERTSTTWAYGLSTAGIFARPSARARRIGRVHLETSDGFPEIYVLLVSHRDAAGRQWVKLRVPGRPNGRTGWVRSSALGSFEQTHWMIVVNLRARRLTAYRWGRLRFRAPVGVGKPSTPTPPGHFWITEHRPVTSRSSPYWPYILGTSDYSTLTEWPGGGIVGIHGDFGEPRRIPGDPSHGCIRMRDHDMTWLARHVTLGTPVEILRGSRSGGGNR